MSPRRKPLARGALEAMVLEVLWDDEGWMIPSEVHAAISDRRRLAYTTIMTTMARLWAKGRLDRRQRGRAFEYRPVLDRTEFAASRMTEILATAGDSRAALARFVSEMDASDVAELRRVLQKRGRSA